MKGLSALISDFRANRDVSLDEIDQDVWEDEDDIAVVYEHDSPGVASRKPWTKKGVKRSKRRVISTTLPPSLSISNSGKCDRFPLSKSPQVMMRLHLAVRRLMDSDLSRESAQKSIKLKLSKMNHETQGRISRLKPSKSPLPRREGQRTRPD